MIHSGRSPLSSEAFFGSAARGECDRFSDLDYLIVDDDTEVLRCRKDWLKSRGFSVSEFTWSRLTRIVQKQTLFALHLKFEARIVCDHHDRLEQLLSSATAKTSYNKDFIRSLDLLRPVESVPNSPEARSWAMDVLAVAYRNSAILKLADDGEYVFSTSKIADALTKRGLLKAGDQHKLQLLRRAKARHRASPNLGGAQRELDSAMGAVSRALGCDFDSRMGGRPHLLNSGPDSVAAYASMRVIEGRLLCIPHRALQTEEIRSRRANLLTRVRDPHNYLWSFLHNGLDARLELEAIEGVI